MKKTIVIIIISILLISGIYWLSLPEKEHWTYIECVSDVQTLEVNYRSQRFMKVKFWILDKILVSGIYSTKQEN